MLAHIQVNDEKLAHELSERYRTEQYLDKLAYYDVTTDLPNRHYFHQQLDSAVEHAIITKQKMVLLFLDLDNFKTVNDSLGHTLGDMLLKKVTQRLENELAGYDMLSRFGGDEFVLLFTNIKDRKNVEDAAIKIHKILKKPFMLKTYEVYTTVSIGISIYPDDAKDSETLLKNADVAMYDAKQSGRSKYSFYKSDMLNLSRNRLMLESELYKALDNEELFLLFQPQISVENEKLVGVEALIRWNHPVKGLISPLEFIPIAENNG